MKRVKCPRGCVPVAGLGRISTLIPGTALSPTRWDYSVMLAPAHRAAGFILLVKLTPRRTLHVALFRGGDIEGEVSGRLVDDVAYVDSSELRPTLRGKGFGTTLYEAFMRQAYALGARTLRGGAHSTFAMHVHKKLSAKHGLKYVPIPNDEAHGGDWPQREWNELENRPSRWALDERWQPYEYGLNGVPGAGLLGAALWRFNERSGMWDRQREVTAETASHWLTRFQHDEPAAAFMLSSRRPKNPPKLLGLPAIPLEEAQRLHREQWFEGKHKGQPEKYYHWPYGVDGREGFVQVCVPFNRVNAVPTSEERVDRYVEILRTQYMGPSWGVLGRRRAQGRIIMLDGNHRAIAAERLGAFCVQTWLPLNDARDAGLLQS